MILKLGSGELVFFLTMLVLFPRSAPVAWQWHTVVSGGPRYGVGVNVVERT